MRARGEITNCVEIAGQGFYLLRIQLIKKKYSLTGYSKEKQRETTQRYNLLGIYIYIIIYIVFDNFK